MRDIEFRGKNILGEWVYGDLSRDVDGTTYIYPFEEYVDITDTAKYGVEPKTIGQYTGLHDMNGTRIFEHDMIRKAGSNGSHWEIAWFDKYARFAARKPEKAFAVFDFTQSKVIGNIFDTPWAYS